MFTIEQVDRRCLAHSLGHCNRSILCHMNRFHIDGFSGEIHSLHINDFGYMLGLCYLILSFHDMLVVLSYCLLWLYRSVMHLLPDAIYPYQMRIYATFNNALHAFIDTACC